MPVRHRLVTVEMRVRLALWIVRPVLMLVRRVVNMAVRVRHRLVGVLVIVPLREMQIQAEPHQQRSDQKLPRLRARRTARRRPGREPARFSIPASGWRGRALT